MTRTARLMVAVIVVLVLAIVGAIAAIWVTVRRDVRQPERPKPPGWQIIHLDTDGGFRLWPDVATFCDHGNRVYVPDVRNGDPSIAAVADPTCREAGR
jgi:hypothetical protein